MQELEVTSEEVLSTSHVDAKLNFPGWTTISERRQGDKVTPSGIGVIT